MKTNLRTGLAFLVVALALSATACNTTRGIGEDLEEAGEKIQDAATR